jgi:TolB-like protein
MFSSNDEKKNNNILAELGRRGVYKAVSLYVAIAWGSIEILLTASERLAWPSWLGDAALILFLTALPFVVFLSWAFDLKSSGLKRMEPGSLTGKVIIAATSTLVLGISGSWFIWNDVGKAAPVVDVQNPGERPVIAVLPFQDLSGQGHGDWLPLAFTDEVINRINAHPDLAAIDLQSVTHPMMEQRLSSESNSAYRVTGKFLPAVAGTTVRARMTNASGRVLWEFEQVFKLQDSNAISAAQKWVAGQVATGLGRSLAGVDYCEPSAIPRAIELYLGAQEKFMQRGPENVAKAALMLEEATELDPNFARALELLSEVYKRFHFWVTQDPSHYGMNEDELKRFLNGQPEIEPARRALDLCSTLGAAYFTIETAISVHQTFADVVDVIEEALRRDPANVTLMGRLVEFLSRMGHIRWADAVAREMYLRDPMSPRVPHVLGMTQALLGNLERSIELENESLSLGYELDNVLPVMSSTYVALRDAMGLEKILGGTFSPSKRMPVDPRDVLLAQTDDVLKADLVGVYQKLVDSGDTNLLRSLSGWSGSSLALELGDEELVWLIMARWAEASGPGGMPIAFWNHSYRQWFGKERMLQLGGYLDLWSDFWDRKGPPDDCAWENQVLNCEWAKHY